MTPRAAPIPRAPACAAVRRCPVCGRPVARGAWRCPYCDEPRPKGVGWPREKPTPASVHSAFDAHRVDRHAVFAAPVLAVLIVALLAAADPALRADLGRLLRAHGTALAISLAVTAAFRFPAAPDTVCATTPRDRLRDLLWRLAPALLLAALLAFAFALRAC